VHVLDQIMFFIAGGAALAGAIGVVVLRNPFFSVLALVGHLLALAGLFLLLHAAFLAAAQVIVYAGAVMVLYVFVVAYVGGMEPMLAGGTGRGLKFFSGFFALALFIELAIALIGTGLAGLDSDGAPYHRPFGEPAEVGRLFLTTYLVVFEIASLLLLIAAVGAVILARRRAGLAPSAAISVTELLRGGELTPGPARGETMLEAGGPPQR
jgi:NADH-quinone oxidoreductase subunit J